MLKKKVTAFAFALTLGTAAAAGATSASSSTTPGDDSAPDATADPAAAIPTWGDQCPDPPGPTDAGCPVLGRVSRLNASAPWRGEEPRSVAARLAEAYRDSRCSFND